jgi:hypothetical protein
MHVQEPLATPLPETMVPQTPHRMIWSGETGLERLLTAQWPMLALQGHWHSHATGTTCS